MVLIDESGFQLQPLVRRTWAPQGKTPELANWDRHDRITAITALTWTPQSDRQSLFFDLQDHNATAIDFVWFLHQLHQELKRPLIVIWDRLAAHRKAARVMKRLGMKWATFEWLSPYFPQLNPVEHVWSTAKWGRLGNWPAADRHTLEAGLLDELILQSLDQRLLENHFRHAGLM